ncbi:hypothetical protein GCM10020295_71440 [Streptomyces cinereospinus]
MTHPAHDAELGGEGRIPAMELWSENATPPATARGGAGIASFPDGLDPLEPGLVSCSA